MRNVKIVGIVVFCGVLFLCAGASLVLPQKDYSDRENRLLAEKPDCSWDNIRSGDYQEQYEKYLNDRMFLRDQWVKLAVSLERAVGRRDINGVYMGWDGYLLERYEESDFDDGRIRENVRMLSAFLNEAAKTYGKKHTVCMMVPSKANAMPDKLPQYAAVNEEQGTVSALKKRLKYPEMLLNVSQELQKHQDEYIYFRTDHHWTALGAYYGYGAWAELTGHRQRPLDQYCRETVFQDFYGTTYNKAPVRVSEDAVELFHGPGEEGIRLEINDGEIVSDSFYFVSQASQGFNRYDVFLSKNTFKIVIDTKAGTGRTLLLLKDSFANCFVPFLAEDYDRIIMIDYRYAKTNIHDIISRYDDITDVLVLYNVEKFMQAPNLQALDKRADTIEEFDPEEFFE